MSKSIFLMIPAYILFLFALPSAAMMGFGDGHGGSGQTNPETRSQPVHREPETQSSGHRHGDYFHSHEGGQLPHSHDEARPAPEHPKGNVTPAPTKKKSSAVKPAGKTTKKTTKQPEPGHGPGGETAVSHPEQKPSAVTPPSAMQSPTTPPAAMPADPVKALMRSDDDVVMRLVRGSGAESAKDAGDGEPRVEDAGDFYMDETHVTNHQYAEFLNKVLPSIKVENGIVWGNGEIWLLLGEVIEGYDPIVFQDGRFRVKGAHHAACAVLRVTAFGALAYARFYGESLPTEEQWKHAASAGAVGEAEARVVPAASPETSGHGDAAAHGGPSPQSGISPTLPIPSPVMLYPANGLGIKGLNANIGEWGLRSVNAPAQDGRVQQEYVVLGGASSQTP